MSGSIELPDGTKRKVVERHGAEVTLKEAGAYETKVLVSPYNQRVQVLHHRIADYGALGDALSALATSNDLTKVFLKAESEDVNHFIEAGFEREAKIRGYFNGEDAHVMSLFLSPERRQPSSTPEDVEHLQKLLGESAALRTRSLPEDLTCRLAAPEDAEPLAALYTRTFASYPFPIDTPDYVRETMATHVVYRLVLNGDGKIIAAASAETDTELEHAEMTDFATTPEARGKGLASYLLNLLEGDMLERGILDLHTLSRASSPAMNAVFHSLGYGFTGTLVRNCSIAGQMEDMHCWCKRLSAA